MEEDSNRYRNLPIVIRILWQTLTTHNGFFVNFGQKKEKGHTYDITFIVVNVMIDLNKGHVVVKLYKGYKRTLHFCKSSCVSKNIL